MPGSSVFFVGNPECVQPNICVEDLYRTWPREHLEYIWMISQIPSYKSRDEYLKKDQKRVGSSLVYSSFNQLVLDEESQRYKEGRYISYTTFPWPQSLSGV